MPVAGTMIKAQKWFPSFELEEVLCRHARDLTEGLAGEERLVRGDEHIGKRQQA